MKHATAERITKPSCRLGPADQGRRMSLEEFFAAGGQEGFRYELIRGRLEVMPGPNMPHERLLDWLRDRLKAYAAQRPDLFNFVAGPARLILEGAGEGVSAPEPDLVCYRDFPLDASFDEVSWQDATPYLAVEIISEGSAEKDLERNIALYLQAPSLREYWVVDPRGSHDRPSMTVYRRRGARWQKPIRVGPGGTYATRLLPGFCLTLDRRA